LALASVIRCSRISWMARGAVVEGNARMYVLLPHLPLRFTAFPPFQLTPFFPGTMQRLLHRARDLLLDPRQPQPGHRHLRRRRRLPAPLPPRLLHPPLPAPREIEEAPAAHAPAHDEYGVAAAAAESKGMGGHGGGFWGRGGGGGQYPPPPQGPPREWTGPSVRYA